MHVGNAIFLTSPCAVETFPSQEGMSSPLFLFALFFYHSS